MSQVFFQLFETLVPESGQAATVQGELVRSVNKIANDYFSNGLANWDDGYERLSKFALRHLTDDTFGTETCAGIRSDLEQFQQYGRGEAIGSDDLGPAFLRLMEATVELCQCHPDPLPHIPDPALNR